MGINAAEICTGSMCAVFICQARCLFYLKACHKLSIACVFLNTTPHPLDVNIANDGSSMKYYYLCLLCACAKDQYLCRHCSQQLHKDLWNQILNLSSSFSQGNTASLE